MNQERDPLAPLTPRPGSEFAQRSEDPVAEPSWSDTAATRASTPRRRMPRVALIGLGMLVAFSLLFSAFAAGMITQRLIAGEPAQAQAATGGAPAAIDTAWNLVQSQYVDPSVVNDAKMTEAAIEGMLQTLGDVGHTRYLTAAETSAENQQLSGAYVGVGIQVDNQNGRIVVITPIDGSPAQEAGVQPGDLLVSIDGVNIVGKTVDQVIPMIRGQEGTQVTLVFERATAQSPLTFTLTRRSITVSSVSWTMLPGNIADIRLSQFSNGAGNDLKAAIAAAQGAGATSIIFDLRNNPGGYIDEAIQVGSLFVPEGSTIFITQVRDGTQTPRLAVAQGVNTGNMPLVVLINEGSASSSEIVAGAIKANNPNATLIGETTFGTGTVLSSYDLGDGSSLLLGTELWLTPEGKLIKDQGIRPNVTVGLPTGQYPFVPINGTVYDPQTVKDYQLEWAIDLINSGQAGEDNPAINLPPGRAS